MQASGADSEDHAPAALNRVLGLPALVFFGLGTMVGGGFYGLLGKVAGEAGLLTPLALACSGLPALVNGFAFAELSARYPHSAGVARYVSEAFPLRWLPGVSGWTVILTALRSRTALSALGAARRLRQLRDGARRPGVDPFALRRSVRTVTASASMAITRRNRKGGLSAARSDAWSSVEIELVALEGLLALEGEVRVPGRM
jgi:hypothetical protein